MNLYNPSSLVQFSLFYLAHVTIVIFKGYSSYIHLLGGWKEIKQEIKVIGGEKGKKEKLM